jgi:hypothetical protein
MFSYIDDVLSLNNSRFGDFIDRIYPIELRIKDTTDTDRSASYLELLHLETDSEWWQGSNLTFFQRAKNSQYKYFPLAKLIYYQLKF